MGRRDDDDRGHSCFLGTMINVWNGYNSRDVGSLANGILFSATNAYTFMRDTEQSYDGDDIGMLSCLGLNYMIVLLFFYSPSILIWQVTLVVQCMVLTCDDYGGFYTRTCRS